MSDLHETSTPRRAPQLKVVLAGIALAALIGASIPLIATVSASATGTTTGVVSGTASVTSAMSEVGPAAAGQVTVKAWKLNANGISATDVATTTTDGTGDWQFASLPVGLYDFEYDFNNGVVGTAKDAGTFQGGGVRLDDELASQTAGDDTFVGLPADAPTAISAVTLLLGDTISGVVRDQASHALSGQTVKLYIDGEDPSGTVGAYSYASTTTAADGAYSFTNLPVGTFVPEAGGSKGYAMQDSDGNFYASPYPQAADAVLSTTNQSVVANFALYSGASISGTVKTTSNAAIGGIDVTAYYDVDDADNEVPIETVTTASNGSYTLANLPANDSIVLHFASPVTASTQYQDSWWQDEPFADWADGIELDAGSHLTGYSVQLSKAGAITGTIATPGASAFDASDISVEACDIQSDDGDVESDADDTYADCDGSLPGVVAANGTYKIGGVTSGSYTVFVSYHGKGNYQDEYYANNFTGENTSKFTVTAGHTTAKINFVLVPGAVVSGHVLSNSLPMAGESVYADQNYGATALEGHSEPSDHVAVTNSSGAYTISGLSAGNYGVRLQPGDDSVAAQWYPGVSAEDQATTFTLTASSVRPGIDFYEVGSSSIHGQVLDAGDNSPIADADVQVELIDGPDAQQSQNNLDVDLTTDDGGYYSATQLPPGDYRVAVDPEDGIHLAQDIGGQPGEADSHVPVISLNSDENTQEDVHLSRGGAYTGKVVDSKGTGIGGVDVSSLDGDGYGDTTTRHDGTFSITGLLPGTHTLDFFTEDGSYDERLVTEAAVGTNSAALPIGSIELLQTSGIRGIVIGTNGKPVANVDVTAIPTTTSGDVVDAFGTDSVSSDDGTFGIYGLAPGSYYLELTPPDGSSYGTQFLGGSTDATLSEAVDVTSEGSTAYREIHIVGGGTITGVVTNKTTGKAIGGVGVTASQTSIDGDNDFGGDDSTVSATTNSKGAYVLPGLTAGSYDLTFNDVTSDRVAGYGSADSTALVRDKTTTTRNASLVPRVHVSGRVLDSTGSPAVELQVQAFPFVDGAVQFGDGPYSDDQSDQQGTGLALTDDLGNYSLSLTPGTYVLEFTTSGDGGASTFLGATDDPADSTKVVATSAPIPNQNVQLPSYDGGISLDVVGANAEPLQGLITVDRLDDSKTTVLSTETIGDYFGSTSIDGATTIRNLATGWYNVTIDAFTDDSSYPEVVRQTYVSNTISDLGEIDLTGAINGSLWWEAQPDPTDVPTIDASAGLQVGDTLTADNGSWSGSPVEYYYHWLRNGHEISGATGSSYTLQPGDANASITLSIGASAADYRNLSFTTAAVGPVAAGAAATVTNGPSVTGTPRVGSTLTANPGQWDLSGVTFSYAWKRTIGAGIPVVVGTSSTYKPTTADVPAGGLPTTLDVFVTAHRPGFADSTPFDVTVPTVVSAVALKQTHTSSVSHNAATHLYSVSAGTWSPTGGTVTYQWREYAAGSTTPTTLGSGSTLLDTAPASATTRLTVLVTDTRAGYTTTSVEVPVRTGEATQITTNPTLTAVSLMPNFVESVNANAVTVPANASLARQWYRDSSAIKGATGTSYTFTTADIGHDVSLHLTASAPGHLVSAPVIIDAGVIQSAVPFSGTTPDITGNAAVGRVLTASIPQWAPAPTTVTYQWYRGATPAPIAKATGKTYTPTSADVGLPLTVRVTGKRSGYATVTGQSDPTAAITNAAIASVTPPSIPIVTTVGSTLTANVGKWDLTPTSYGYQWLRNGNPIPYATSSTYAVLPSDLANQISVMVLPAKAGLASSTAVQSNSVTVQLGAAVHATKAPVLTIGGHAATTLHISNVVTASAGTWPAVALDLSYQWQVNRNDDAGFVDLPGETSHQLYLSSDVSEAGNFAVGYSYRVVVTATRVGYADSPAIPSATLTMK